LAVTDLYLLDKSALARVARQPTVRAALERLDDIGVLATSAVIDLEIGYSARNLAEFDPTRMRVVERRPRSATLAGSQNRQAFGRYSTASPRCGG